MQAGQGGGLASLGGGTASQVLGGRQATTILTQMTWWTGGIFMGLALLLIAVQLGARGSGLLRWQKQLLQQSRRQQDLPAAPLPGATTAPPVASPPPPPSSTPGPEAVIAGRQRRD